MMNKLALLQTAIIEAANVNSKSWDGSLVETNHITSIGNILYSNLFVLLIIISLVLLLAMVGTIVITLKRETNLKQANLESRLGDIAILLFSIPLAIFVNCLAKTFPCLLNNGFTERPLDSSILFSRLIKSD